MRENFFALLLPQKDVLHHLGGNADYEREHNLSTCSKLTSKVRSVTFND